MTAPVPEIILLKLPSSSDGEQFVMIDREEMFPTLRPGAPASKEHWMQQFAKLLARPRMTETEVRDALRARGLEDAAIDEKLAASRRKFDVMTSAPTAWLQPTRIGSRNREGQVVMRKTKAGGPEGQRIFVLRCSVCGHEYGAYGIDADIRRCPACQDGPPGLPIP